MFSMMRRGAPLVGLFILGFGLACSGVVQGERAANGGACPDGEVCSSAVEGGLLFFGQVLYDEGLNRLGPVIVGGSFELNYANPFGAALPGNVAIPSGAGEVLSTHTDGVVLVGNEPGTLTVRVVDRETEELFDRLRIEVVALERVELVNVNEPERPFLYDGCAEMVGVRLVAKGGTMRAFDNQLRVNGPGRVTLDPGLWDCFLYEPDLDAPIEEATFEVSVAGQTHLVSMPVQPLPLGQDCSGDTSD